MKKEITLIACMLPTVAFSQGLFDIAPNDEASESEKLSYTVGARVGWDSNISPGLSDETDSATLSAFIGAKGVRVIDRTTLEYYGRYSANYTSEEPNGDGDRFSNNISGGLNYAHTISERIRISSRNHIGYQLEPDYAYGFANTRAVDEYFTWSTDNSLGYRFSERFGAFFGFTLNGVEYSDDFDALSRSTWSVYTQGRYQVSPRTTLTAGYRFRSHDNGDLADAESHIITVGAEQRFSSRAVGVIKAGVQLHETDGGRDRSAPYIEFALRNRVSEKTNLRLFGRYGITNYDTSFGGGSYDVNETFRFGLSATHSISSKLSVHGGVNAIFNDYSDSAVLADADATLFNINAGFIYNVGGGLNITGSANSTTSSSDDIAARDYDRVRLNLGVNYSF